MFFSEVGGTTYEHKIIVPDSIGIPALTAQVAKELGKPADEIKL